jgi:dynein heavy chain
MHTHAHAQELDPVLDPVLDKSFVRKGKSYVVTLGDKECDVEVDSFQLFITCRMPNPHFTPELSARVTVIDFTVTMKGLEDQLLARVVLQEKPELQEERRKLLEEVRHVCVCVCVCVSVYVYVCSMCTL